MFSQRSAFDEALSRPLVPAADEQSTSSGRSGRSERSGGGKKKKKKGKAGTNGAGTAPSSGSAPANTTGRLPSFDGYRPPSSGAPPSAVSSVVSEDDAPRAEAAFDPALSESFDATGDGEAEGALMQTLEQEGHQSLEEVLLQERHSALAEVARSMGLVHTIQRDLSAIVSSQQEDIDDIEANAIEVHEATDRGVEQLERARGHMRSGGWGGAILVSVMVTSIIAAIVFWLLAK